MAGSGNSATCALISTLPAFILHGWIMPRKRMIDPEFWSDEEIGNWSPYARLLYIGLWNFADDEGRFKANESLLKAQIFPYDSKINLGMLLEELKSKIQLYQVNGSHYGHLYNFLKHQRIDKPQPSKLPAPLPFQECSPNNPGTFPPNLKEENLKEENRSKDNTISPNNLGNDFVQYWNSKKKLKEIRVLSDTRRTKLNIRFKDPVFLENWKTVVDKIAESRFCCGENERKWTATLEWLISNDTNYVKVLEGKYDNRTKSTEKMIEELKEEGRL